MDTLKIKITDFLEFLKNNEIGKNSFSDFIATSSTSSNITSDDYNEAESIFLYDPEPKSYIKYDFNLMIQENQQLPNLTKLTFDKSLIMSNIYININRAIDLDILCNVEDTNIELYFNKVFKDSSHSSKNEVALSFSESKTNQIYVNNLTITNELDGGSLNLNLPNSSNILIRKKLDLRNLTLLGKASLVPLNDLYMENLINAKSKIVEGRLSYSGYVESLKSTYKMLNTITGEQEGMKVISNPNNLTEIDDQLSEPLFVNKLNSHNRFSSFIHFFLPVKGYDNITIEVVQPNDIKKSKLKFKSVLLSAKTGYTLTLEEDAVFEISRIFKKVSMRNDYSHFAIVDKDNEFWKGDRLLLKAGTVLSLLPIASFLNSRSYLETKNFTTNK